MSMDNPHPAPGELQHLGSSESVHLPAEAEGFCKLIARITSPWDLVAACAGMAIALIVNPALLGTGLMMGLTISTALRTSTSPYLKRRQLLSAAHSLLLLLQKEKASTRLSSELTREILLFQKKIVSNEDFSSRLAGFVEGYRALPKRRG